jgi:hypothetical protein
LGQIIAIGLALLVFVLDDRRRDAIAGGWETWTRDVPVGHPIVAEDVVPPLQSRCRDRRRRCRRANRPSRCFGGGSRTPWTLGKEADVGEPQVDKDEWDDDWEFKPPPGPTPNQRRQRRAEKGNVQALLDEIRNTPASLYHIGEMLRYVERAVQVKARTNPEAHAKETLARIVAFNSYLLIRLQTFVAGRIAGHDRALRDVGRVEQVDFPADVIEKFLPRVVELQQNLGETLLIQAQVTRLWALTRAKEAERGLAAKSEPEEPRRPRKAKSSGPGGSTPHQANGKAHATPNGVVPGSDGGRLHG